MRIVDTARCVFRKIWQEMDQAQGKATVLAQ